MKFIEKINISMTTLFSLMLLLILPIVASAQETLVAVIVKITQIVDAVVPLIIGIAIVFFLWGIFRYIFAQAESDKKEAKGVIMYGIVAIFVMVSVWGLVRIVASLFEFELGGSINVEQQAPSSLYNTYLDPSNLLGN